MQTKTLFAGVTGGLIALLLGIVVLQRFEIQQSDTPQPIPYLLLLAAVGGVTGGLIASPVPEKSDRFSKTSEEMK